MSVACNKLHKMFKSKYLLWFANENVDFRLPEIKSILKLFNIHMTWVEKPMEDPFWIVELPSEEDAKKIASRSVTLRSIIKLWGAATDIKDLHKILKSYPVKQFEEYFSPHISFQVRVETFGKTFTMKEKVDKIEWFNYLPAQGPVKLHDPDVTLYYIEYYGLIPNEVPENPYYLYFGVWICDGQRELISKYSLKKRKFIGNTSMDAQFSFIMANQGLIKQGDLVMDPFVGTGSLLVSAACFGAYVLGTDIDFLMLHGKTRPTRKQDRSKPRANESIFANLKQYGIESQYIDVVVGDSSLPLWHDRLKLDSILTDPPYGIREATERIGSTRDYKIKDQHLHNHIPSKIEYGLTQIYRDLLDFAAKRLKINGRLVSWIPVYKVDYDDSKLPKHPCLQLVANSEQTLTIHTSRRLLTWEKIAEVQNDSDQPEVPELFPQGFREHYFGHGETRKQRRARLLEEMKEKDLNRYMNGEKNLDR